MEEPEDLHLVVQHDFDSADARALIDILEEHNALQTNARRTMYAISLRNGDDELVGGVTGTMAWGLLYVKTLAVQARYRGLGHGSRLLAAAEAEGRANGCRTAHLHTMSFQAPVFYQKRGYTVFEVLDGTPAEYKRYFLKKTLE